MSDTVLPAAWYPDPDEPARLRWWDGGGWTDHVQEVPAPPTSAPVVAEPDPFIIRTHVEEAGTWYAETGNRASPRTARIPVVTSERGTSDDSDKDDSVGSGWTIEIWILAFLPGIAFGVQYALWNVGAGTGEIFTHSPILFWLVPLALVITGPFLTTMDRGTLIARNFAAAPHAMLGLLPPVYLAVRASRVGASSLLPLLIWCAFAVVLYVPARKLLTAFLMVMSQLAQ